MDVSPIISSHVMFNSYLIQIYYFASDRGGVDSVLGFAVEGPGSIADYIKFFASA